MHVFSLCIQASPTSAGNASSSEKESPASTRSGNVTSSGEAKNEADVIIIEEESLVPVPKIGSAVDSNARSDR
jgi:hypothetical protein